MIEEVILLGYCPYSFNDDQGKKVEGISVWVLPTEKDTNTNIVGYFPCKYNLPYSELDSLAFPVYPCKAKAVFKINLVSKKVTLSTFKDLTELTFN